MSISRCLYVCFIALFVALSDQEKSVNKQLATGAPYSHLLSDLLRFGFCG